MAETVKKLNWVQGVFNEDFQPISITAEYDILKTDGNVEKRIVTTTDRPDTEAVMNPTTTTDALVADTLV